ncbi:S-ribosylhomocysteine lyase LuxS involved in autoinducer biosynthesis [Kitasatospora sp. MAP12-15]|nr:hypothetical protein [Kitasatospora sp. MAP12-44]MDH6114794.1 S-ribosylhomocysteine lyase LuxS involved in autoinducer biosynthesis [Kitasatospora sp. MAP12-44]
MDDMFNLDVEELSAPTFEETGAADAVNGVTFHSFTGRVCNPDTGCIC